MNSADKTQITFASGATISMLAFTDNHTFGIAFQCEGAGKFTRACEVKPLRLAANPAIVASVGHLALDQQKLDMVNAAIAQVKAGPAFASYTAAQAAKAALRTAETNRPRVIGAE
jgi:hypothetical protein